MKSILGVGPQVFKKGIQSYAGEVAKDIADALLERSGIAMVADDFQGFLDCMHLPHSVQAFEGTQYAETSDDVQKIFSKVRNFWVENDITMMARHCVEASFLTPDLIHATHISRLLSHDQIVMRPYPGFTELVRENGTWRIGNSSYAVADSPELSKVLAGDVSSE